MEGSDNSWEIYNESFFGHKPKYIKIGPAHQIDFTQNLSDRAMYQQLEENYKATLLWDPTRLDSEKVGKSM